MFKNINWISITRPSLCHSLGITLSRFASSFCCYSYSQPNCPLASRWFCWPMARPPPSRPRVVVMVKRWPRGPVQYLYVPAHPHFHRALCLSACSALVTYRCLKREEGGDGPTAPTQPTPAAACAYFFHRASLWSDRVRVGDHQAWTWVCLFLHINQKRDPPMLGWAHLCEAV